MWTFRSQGSFSAQLVLAVVIFCMAGAIGAAILGFSATSRIDAEAGQRQIRFARDGLQTQRDLLPKEQHSSTVWDDAVINARIGNRDWLEANLGVWMHEYFGHDQSYILRPDDSAIYAAVEGKTVDPAAFATAAQDLLPLVGRLRDDMRAATTDSAESTDAISSLYSTDMVDVGGKLALVSVTPIVPDTGRLTQAPGTEFLHVAVQYVDPSLVNRIAGPFELKDATVERTAPATRQKLGTPLTDGAGQVLGYLTWTRDRPGLQLILAMVPAIALIGAVGLALLAFLIRKLWLASSRLHRSEAEARHLALHDGLTGLPNRALFDDRLAQALRQAERDETPVSLLCLDLDRFKDVNDTLGHPAGDQLIRQASARISDHLRAADTVARVGGDEFAIILIGMAEDSALKTFCISLIERLSAPYVLDAGVAHVSASIGAVVASAVQGGPAEALRNADTALYRAKNDGRSRCSIFTPDMDDVMRRRHEVERDLRDALDQGDQISVAYQPVFDHDGRLIGAEALARWAHPVHGLLPTEVFIGIAEERGLIHRLGRSVLAEACRFAAAEQLPKIAVNVSPVQLRDEGFAQVVLDILAETGLPPSRLELELTEKIALDSGGVTRSALRRLRAAGVSIALDDFATGQSSLQYVRDYDIDVLKIDRSFVRRLGLNDGSDQLVQAIIDLARAMGIRVTAEGVETAAQRDALIAMGCRCFQGFLLGKPMDAPRLAALSSALRASQHKLG